MLRETFDENHVAPITGSHAQHENLTAQKFDFIFFTGSGAAGRDVLQKAAANLTPVLLELGGKSPVLIDESANIPLAAKRVAFGKCLNAGQTCVAPGYSPASESEKRRIYFGISKGRRGILSERNVRRFSRDRQRASLRAP